MLKNFLSLKNQPKKLNLIINNYFKPRSTFNPLKQKFNTQLTQNLVKKFNYTSVIQLPKIHKILLNIPLPHPLQNSKLLHNPLQQLQLITPQKPLLTKPKKSLPTFPLPQPIPIPPKLTLRPQTIYQFLHKLIPLSLPPLPHFQPLSKTPFHRRPNYTLPLKQQLIFPQIHY
uniref:50S ribosomal protein L5 n=1 Tax=Staphylococcus epidermidis TaxID=1282 RepID=UPI0011A31331